MWIPKSSAFSPGWNWPRHKYLVVQNSLHRWYLLSTFTWTHFIYATYPCLICLVHNLICDFVLIGILVYLFSAWSQPSSTRWNTLSSRIYQNDACQEISKHTHICVYRDISILYILHNTLWEKFPLFFLSCLHIFMYFMWYTLALRKPDH